MSVALQELRDSTFCSPLLTLFTLALLLKHLINSISWIDVFFESKRHELIHAFNEHATFEGFLAFGPFIISLLQL